MNDKSAKRLFVLVGLATQVVAAVLIVAWRPQLIVQAYRGPAPLLWALALGAVLYAILTRDFSFKRVRVGDSALRSIKLTVLLLITGTAEEVIWRGWVFGFFDARYGVVAAILFTTALFAGMHAYSQKWAGLRTHAITGLGFGIVRGLTGSLAAAMLAHAAYNVLVLASRRMPATKIIAQQPNLREINATH